MAISLPRRSSGTTARSRGINLPAAANVPKTSAGADPGLPRQSIPSSVPQGAFGGPQARGLQSLGQGVSDLGFGVQQAAVRQQKRYDATRTTEALLAFERESMEEFRRRQTEDDPARPKFMPDFENDLKGRREEALKSLEDVSPDAVEDLSLRLESSANGMVDAAGRLSLQASQKAADDAMAGTVNQLSAQAERDPDFLKSILSEGASRLSVFNGTMTADQKRDQLQKARQQIILSGVAGLVKSGRILDAEILLSGEFDEDLTREQRAQGASMIAVGEKDIRLALERAEAKEEKRIKKEQEITADEFTARLWAPGAEPLVYADVVASNLEASQKRVFLGILDNEDKASRISEPLYNELFTEIVAGRIRPDEMAGIVLPFVGNGITPENYSSLRLAAKKTQELEVGKSLSNFVDMAKAQITKSNLFTNDPAGDRLFFEFNSRLNRRIEEEQKKGTPLSELLNPDSGNFLGSMIGEYIRTPRQQIQDRAKQLRGEKP